jgi:hypothetical protein
MLQILLFVAEIVGVIAFANNISSNGTFNYSAIFVAAVAEIATIILYYLHPSDGRTKKFLRLILAGSGIVGVATTFIATFFIKPNNLSVIVILAWFFGATIVAIPIINILIAFIDLMDNGKLTD